MQDHRTWNDSEPMPASDTDRPSGEPWWSDTPAHSPRHSAFGHVVRYTRTQRGFSQETLGERADLHRNYVGAIERGEINPTLRVLLKLAAGLSAQLSELIAEAEKLDPGPRHRSYT